MKHSYRNFLRNRKVGIISVSVVVALVIFLLIFSDNITTYRSELEDSYAALSATARIKAKKATAKPQLEVEEFRTILDSGFVASYGVMADHDLMDMNVLRGVNGPNIDPTLRDQLEEVEWRPGFDSTSFFESEMVCLVPDVYMVEYGDTWELEIEDQMFTLTIAGIYGSLFSDNGVVYYCPVDTLQEIYRQADVPFYYNTFEMELQNLPELDNFKALLRELGLDDGGTRVVINDSRLQSITSQLKRQIRLLETLLPVLLALVAGVSFGLSFLLLRGRKREAAILRSLGMRRRSVFAALEGEIALQALLGLLIGAGIGFSTLGAQALQPKYMAALLICYLLGGGFAAWKISGINVFNIMTARE